MASDRNLELALLVKANVDQARKALRDLNVEIANVETTTKGASASSSAQATATSSVAEAAERTTTAVREETAAVSASIAASGAKADAEKQVVKATSAVAASAEAAAETDTQRTSRIREMVQASLARAEAEKTVRAAEQASAAATAQVTETTDASAAARQRAYQVALAQRNQVVREMADYGALQKILEGGVKQRTDLAAAEKLLDDLQARGALTTDELTTAFAALNKVTEKNTAANVANVASRRTMSSGMTAELGTAASEVAAGNFGRLRRTGAAFLNQSGILQKAFTPAGLAVVGLTASVATLALAYKHAVDEVTDINTALIRSGNVANVSAGQIESLAGSLNSVSHSTAVETLTQLVASGRVSADQLHKVGQAAVDLATLTDQSVKDATSQIIDMMKSPAKGAAAFDDATHSLTAAQLQEITTLENTGNRAEAAALLLDAVATSTKNGANAIRNALPWYEKLFHNIGSSSSDFFSQVGNVLSGRNRYGFSAEDLKNPLNQQASLNAQAQRQLGQLKAAIANYKDALASGRTDLQSMYGSYVTAYQGDLQKTYSQLSQLENSASFLAAKRAAAAKQFASDVDQAGKDAQNTLRSLGINTTKMMSYAQKLQAARQAIVDMYDSHQALPADVKLNTATYEPFGPGWEKIKKQLQGPQQHNDAAERAAQASTKAAASANQQLRDSFIQLQAAADPTAAAWARYNKTVDAATQAEAKANANLDKLVKHHKLSAAAADQQRAANAGLVAGIKALAKGTRKAAIGKLADADRKAWEKLQQGLRTPAQVAADGAIAKLKELKKLLDAGDTGMTQSQHDAAAQNAIAGAFAGGPKLRRVHNASPGGGILDMQSQEQNDFAARQAFLVQTRDAILQNDATTHQERLAAQRLYQQQSDALLRQHVANQHAIEIQKANFALSTAQQGFGALAQASATAFGQQSKAARAAFALQKAAAVASATLAIAQSVASSSKLGFPWNLISIAGAVAQGVSLLASVTSVQPGYAEGGYTGAGGKHQVAGVVHAGEVVWSQADIARAGGVGMVEAWRRGLPGYANGGVVNPLANAPSPADLGITASATPRLDMRSMAAASQAPAPAVHVKTVMVMNSDQLASEILNTPTGTKLVIQHVGNNPRAVQGKWRS